MKFNTIPKKKEWLKFLKNESENEHSLIRVPATFNGRDRWKSLIADPLFQGQCAACWAFASASALSDRFNIQSMGRLHLTLSPTRLILCAAASCNNKDNTWVDPLLFGCDASKMAGCEKGTTMVTAAIFLFLFGTFENKCLPADKDLIVHFPTPEEIKSTSTDPTRSTAQSPLMEINGKYIYPSIQRSDDEHVQCTSVTGTYSDTCASLEYARHWRAKTFYTISGISDLKYDIYRWGTVMASIIVTPHFQAWATTKPSFDKEVYMPPPVKAEQLERHSICIIGWGEQNGTKYWIIKNSWESLPYFKYAMSTASVLNDNSIETNCIGFVPDFFIPLDGIREKIKITDDLLKLKRQVDGELSGKIDIKQTIDSSNGYTRRALANSPGLDIDPPVSCKIPNWDTFTAGLLPSGKICLWLKRTLMCVKPMDVIIFSFSISLLLAYIYIKKRV